MPSKLEKFRPLIVLGLILAVATVVFAFISVISRPAADEEMEKEVVIEPGESLSEIADVLHERGLIRNETAFKAYVYLEGVAGKLQAGIYNLSTAMSIKDIVRVISRGQLLSNERTIKILEGWNNREIGDYLEKNEIVSRADFLAAAGATNSKELLPDENYDFLADKDSSVDLEGYLFPDTYRIYKNSQAKDIIKKMLNNFGKKVTLDLRQEIESQGKTIFEIVTMASILEKELTKYEDRQMGADLFYRRLEIGMPMQSDATVNYVTGKSERQPTYSDLETVSPYNTYLNKGLPPGPICNPSLSSIKAAIYPTPNEYFYYLNKKDGTTVWSKTGEEHAANKAKYLD